ncbi:hypothetical protein E2C01_001100 [Portunus trituberculatus]|uniref:Uncharacterized protein n=1 Tax=Portunus trituberculatus TaxID=210409 RepID=A0A5B7CLN5_PORTR|nr:hypothetical protein [Portunus trituberculatus]
MEPSTSKNTRPKDGEVIYHELKDDGPDGTLSLVPRCLAGTAPYLPPRAHTWVPSAPLAITGPLGNPPRPPTYRPTPFTTYCAYSAPPSSPLAHR